MAKTAAERSASASSSDGLPPDEVFQRWLVKIRPAVNKLNRMIDTARKQRATVSTLYHRAEKDGCNRKGFTTAIALLGKTADEVAIEQRTIGRILRVAEHPLVTTHGLFPDLPFAEKPPTPYHAGLTVGQAAGSIDECPHKPGSADFAEWHDGWKAGQRINMDNLRRASGAATATH